MRNILVLAALLLCLVTATKTAQAQELPASCYTNGYVDLRVCMPNRFWEIPHKALWSGYYGTRGRFIEELPAARMDSWLPGWLVRGNASRYDSEALQAEFLADAAALGIDPSNYAGGIALESCGHIGYSVTVEIPARGVRAGPFLVVDCRSLIHKAEIACDWGTIVEADYALLGIAEETGLIEDVLVYVLPPGDLSQPAPQPSEAFVHYPSAWLDEAGIGCS